MDNKLIAGWVYKKGELAKKRLDNFIIGLSMLISFAICMLAMLPVAAIGPVKEKLGTWLFIIAFIIIGVVIYFVLRLCFNALFSIYKKISGIGEEEIIFTYKRISSTNKSWVLNDRENKLTSITFMNKGHKIALMFKGVNGKQGKTKTNFMITIPVPEEEKRTAEKVYNYYQAQLDD